MPDNKVKKPTAIDCFCGAGGLSLGFKLAGFDIEYAFDLDEASIRTHELNLGPHAFVEDIHNISKRSIEARLGKSLDDLSVVVGGPPCQGFSVQRRGDDSDPRNDLVLEFARLVIELSPPFFLMENVGGLLAPRGLPVMQRIKERFAGAGYVLHIKKLNAFDYGVPQVRKRVFIVGEKLETAIAKFTFPPPLENRTEAAATAREAIWDLMDKNEDDVPNHRADRLSAINLERIRSIKEGEGRDSLPPHLQLDCHRNNSTHRHLDVYGRMAWDKPSPTITARFDSFSRGRFGHPVLDRTVTLREGARLQTFPDSFLFFGSKVEVARQIGNAVPPLLAKAIAERIKEYL